MDADVGVDLEGGKGAVRDEDFVSDAGVGGNWSGNRLGPGTINTEQYDFRLVQLRRKLAEMRREHEKYNADMDRKLRKMEAKIRSVEREKLGAVKEWNRGVGRDAVGAEVGGLGSVRTNGKRRKTGRVGGSDGEDGADDWEAIKRPSSGKGRGWEDLWQASRIPLPPPPTQRNPPSKSIREQETKWREEGTAAGKSIILLDDDDDDDEVDPSTYKLVPQFPPKKPGLMVLIRNIISQPSPSSSNSKPGTNTLRTRSSQSPLFFAYASSDYTDNEGKRGQPPSRSTLEHPQPPFSPPDPAMGDPAPKPTQENSTDTPAGRHSSSLLLTPHRPSTHGHHNNTTPLKSPSNPPRNPGSRHEKASFSSPGFFGSYEKKRRALGLGPLKRTDLVEIDGD